MIGPVYELITNLMVSANPKTEKWTAYDNTHKDLMVGATKAVDIILDYLKVGQTVQITEKNYRLVITLRSALGGIRFRYVGDTYSAPA